MLQTHEGETLFSKDKNACIWNRMLVFNDVQIYEILENQGINFQYRDLVML